MPKDSPSSAWVGAPPVSEDGFAFGHGEFFAEASNHNRHRRATLAELKTHFTSGSDKDHPAHWFEAQLIHYGLPPSKTKSVARMRLFDAINAGKLTVPAHIAKLEGKLKKDWTKNDREAKKAAKSGEAASSKATSSKATSSKATVAGAKRKGEDSTAAPAKKTKAAAPKAKPTPKAAAKPAAKPAPKPEAAPKPPKKQTARRGGISQGPSRSTPATATAIATATTSTSSPAHTPRIKQTARRSAPFMGGRISAPPPPPYSEYPEDDYGSSGDHDSDDYDEDQDMALAPLGLLNGDYDIRSRFVTSEWPDLGSDFNLTLTLSGSRLWGSFSLGVIEGVLLFDERPWESSSDCVPFTWRETEDNGPVWYGNDNHGWIRFLGGGRIEGYFDYQGLTFRGSRVPRQGTASGISARAMQDEWNGYSEEEYERQNRARWG